jgi:hypothetical protein
MGYGIIAETYKQGPRMQITNDDASDILHLLREDETLHWEKDGAGGKFVAENDAAIFHVYIAHMEHRVKIELKAHPEEPIDILDHIGLFLLLMIRVKQRKEEQRKLELQKLIGL